MIILHLSPPGSSRKIATFNCWMPHSGYANIADASSDSNILHAAWASLSDKIHELQSKQFQILLMGDLNATIHLQDRSKHIPADPEWELLAHVSSSDTTFTLTSHQARLPQKDAIICVGNMDRATRNTTVEMIQVLSSDQETGQVTVKRGVLNTAPTTHNAQTPLGRIQRISIHDPTDAPDKLLQSLLEECHLQDVGNPHQHTWESERDGRSARLDHCLADRSLAPLIVCDTDDPGLAHSDHLALVTTFHRDFGTWFEEKHRARYRAGNRLDMSDWKDKRPLLTGEIEAQMSLAKAETVEDIEKCLLQAAEKILGRTKAPTGRPPFRTPDARNHAQEIKQMRKALRQLRSDQHPTDSTLTALKEHLHWEPSLDTGATLLSEAILAQKGDEIRKAITLARREYKNEIWAIQRSNLDKACIKKRNNLFTKRGAIQAAMGRFHCYDQIDTLYTTHPDTVTIQVPHGSTLTITKVEQCLHDNNILAQCKPSIDLSAESSSGISITATQK